VTTNPWLDIPLADYEAHMALPQVAQASLLADIFGTLLREQIPASVAVLGCAGGNGFERIDPAATERVVGVDINPSYVRELRLRFQGCFGWLDAICVDLDGEGPRCAPVELAYAALLFEYVEVPVVLARLAVLVVPGGVLGTVVQLPNPTVPVVTPSPYTSLGALSERLRLVPPDQLRAWALRVGFCECRRRELTAAGGKRFCAQVFRRESIGEEEPWTTT
jgi:hypothetical protein